jgi:hypothetical protein
LPSLRAKNNEVLLRELLKRWSSHKIITCWLSRLFGSLETFGTTKISLKEIGFLSFYDLVGHDSICLKLFFSDDYILLTKLRHASFIIFFCVCVKFFIYFYFSFIGIYVSLLNTMFRLSLTRQGHILRLKNKIHIYIFNISHYICNNLVKKIRNVIYRFK